MTSPPALPFDRFIAIDWSGAKGASHPGIAIAECRAGQSAPTLVVAPRRHWSRADVLDWLSSLTGRTLIGFDFSFAPPQIERGSYLPGDHVPDSAIAFWAYVDAICDDPDLGAASFLEHHHRRHFYFGAADGRKADYMHLRRCEARQNALGGGKPSTVFDAIGAAQVAKASFAGMRLLHRIATEFPVWPMMNPHGTGPVIIEIYTQIAARSAGLRKGLSKIRDADSLDAGLAQLGSDPHLPLARYTDHATDAIIAAAWLRANAHQASLWSPPMLTPQVAATEGWTFGIV